MVTTQIRRRARFSVPRLFMILATGVAAAVLVTAVSASTASNTIPETQSGEGAAGISGYVMSSVHYTLNAADPTLIDSVEFTLDNVPAAGSNIHAKLESTGSTWYACTNTGTAASCTTTSPQATAAAADELRIVVAQ